MKKLYYPKPGGRLRKLVSSLILTAFVTSLIVSPAGAQVLPLAAPSSVAGFQPLILVGLKIHPENPFLFDFIVDQGQNKLSSDELKSETEKLVKYFLAALTIPDKDSWVNLSPYEKDRIIPDALGQTIMGKTMLEQDYVLKQLASSLTNPEEKLGQEFWTKVRAQAGQDNVEASTLSKVWIVPQKAEVLENGNIVVIGEKRLKVMMQEEYEKGTAPFSEHNSRENEGQSPTNRGQSLIFRSTILPSIEKEINEGKNFAGVRQVYNSVILATWFKQALKESLLGKIYADQSKVVGVTTDDKEMKQRIYEQYLAAFKKGAYNLIKEEEDPATGEMIARKYFSGGTFMVFQAGQFSRKASSSLSMQPVLSSGKLDARVQLGTPDEVSVLEAGARQEGTQSASSSSGILSYLNNTAGPFVSSLEKLKYGEIINPAQLSTDLQIPLAPRMNSLLIQDNFRPISGTSLWRKLAPDPAWDLGENRMGESEKLGPAMQQERLLAETIAQTDIYEEYVAMMTKLIFLVETVQINREQYIQQFWYDEPHANMTLLPFVAGIYNSITEDKKSDSVLLTTELKASQARVQNLLIQRDLQFLRVNVDELTQSIQENPETMAAFFAFVVRYFNLSKEKRSTQEDIFMLLSSEQPSIKIPLTAALGLLTNLNFAVSRESVATFFKKTLILAGNHAMRNRPHDSSQLDKKGGSAFSGDDAASSSLLSNVPTASTPLDLDGMNMHLDYGFSMQPATQRTVYFQPENNGTESVYIIGYDPVAFATEVQAYARLTSDRELVEQGIVPIPLEQGKVQPPKNKVAALLRTKAPYLKIQTLPNNTLFDYIFADPQKQHKFEVGYWLDKYILLAETYAKIHERGVLPQNITRDNIRVHLDQDKNITGFMIMNFHQSKVLSAHSSGSLANDFPVELRKSISGLTALMIQDLFSTFQQHYIAPEIEPQPRNYQLADSLGLYHLLSPDSQYFKTANITTMTDLVNRLKEMKANYLQMLAKGSIVPYGVSFDSMEVTMPAFYTSLHLEPAAARAAFNKAVAAFKEAQVEGVALTLAGLTDTVVKKHFRNSISLNDKEKFERVATLFENMLSQAYSQGSLENIKSFLRENYKNFGHIFDYITVLNNKRDNQKYNRALAMLVRTAFAVLTPQERTQFINETGYSEREFARSVFTGDKLNSWTYHKLIQFTQERAHSRSGEEDYFSGPGVTVPDEWIAERQHQAQLERQNVTLTADTLWAILKRSSTALRSESAQKDAIFNLILRVILYEGYYIYLEDKSLAAVGDNKLDPALIKHLRTLKVPDSPALLTEKDIADSLTALGFENGVAGPTLKAELNKTLKRLSAYIAVGKGNTVPDDENTNRILEATAYLQSLKYMAQIDQNKLELALQFQLTLDQVSNLLTSLSFQQISTSPLWRNLRMSESKSSSSSIHQEQTKADSPRASASFDNESALNPAVALTPVAPGGIDFDPTNMNLQIKRNGKGVPLPLLQQNLEQIHIDGLFPVIINIVPITAENLPIFLGQAPKEPGREPDLAINAAS